MNPKCNRLNPTGDTTCSRWAGHNGPHWGPWRGSNPGRDLWNDDDGYSAVHSN